MSNLIIACKTIKGELSQVLKVTGVDYPVLYIESGLHNYPERLGQKIQEEIDKIENVDTILLAYGFCGNSLLGVKSPIAKLIVPKADDCISLLLGSYQLRQDLAREEGTYFLTKGWLENEQSLISEFERSMKVHGREKAIRIMKVMLKHYQRLMIIQTGAYELEDILKTTEDFADTIDIKHQVIDGSSRFLKKLLLGPWDEEFLVINPGEKITLEHMKI